MERWNRLMAALLVVALAAGLFIAGSLVPSSTGAAPPDPAEILVAQAGPEEQDIRVQVDGRYLSFDVPPMIEEGRTLVPLRALFEALGAQVQWNGETQTVTAVKGDVTVRLTVGSNVAYVNDRPVTLDVPAKIVRGRTLVPVRFVSETLGAQVAWDAATRLVSVTTPAGEVKVQVDGKYLTFDVPPMIEQGRTLVPLRALFEALGAQVQWNGETQTVTAVKGDVTVRLSIGSNVAYVNDRPVTLDVPARIVRGRTLVPLRFVSEALGAQVAWDATTRLVSVVTGAGAAPAKEAEKPTEEVAEQPSTTPSGGGGGGGGGGTAAPATVKTLRFGTTRDIKTTNLFQDYWYGILAMIMTHETLVRFDPQLNYVPGLAKSWESSADGKKWKFYLRDGATWHDGTPITPEDVKFSLEYYAEKNPQTGWLKAVLESVKTEGNAVEVNLKIPYGTFLTEAMVLRLVPKHVWSKVDDPLKYTGQDAVVGSGPYVFEKFDPEAKIVTFKANQNYYKGAPRVERVEYRIYGNMDALTMALSKGEVDAYYNYASGYDYPCLPALMKSPEIRFLTHTHIGIPAALGFNLERFPMNTKEFRQAVSYAINYAQINEYGFSRYGTVPTGGFVPPTMPDYHDQLPKLKYDPAEANRILDSLGLNKGADDFRKRPDGGDLELLLLGRNTAEEQRILELVKRYLEEVGLKVRLKTVDQNTWISLKDKKDYDLVFFRTTPWGMLMHASYGSGYFDPRRTGAGVLHNYDNQEFKSTCDEIMSTTDRARIRVLNRKLQELYARDLPAIALCWTDMVYPYRANWKGWQVHMIEGGLANHFSWFSLEPVEQK